LLTSSRRSKGHWMNIVGSTAAFTSLLSLLLATSGLIVRTPI